MKCLALFTGNDNYFQPLEAASMTFYPIKDILLKNKVLSSPLTIKATY